MSGPGAPRRRPRPPGPRQRPYTAPRQTHALGFADIAALAVEEPVAQNYAEPVRGLCEACFSPVLIAIVYADPKRHSGARTFIAEPYEWHPRGRCPTCAKIEARANRGAPKCEVCNGRGRLKVAERNTAPLDCEACEGRGYLVVKVVKRPDCTHCDGSGYVGEHRPEGELLAVDCAWSDEGHVRLIGPNTSRRKGEALYRAHACEKLLTAA